MKTRRRSILKQLIDTSAVAVLAFLASDYMVENKIATPMTAPQVQQNQRISLNQLTPEQKLQLLKQYQGLSN